MHVKEPSEHETSLNTVSYQTVDAMIAIDLRHVPYHRSEDGI